MLNVAQSFVITFLTIIFNFINYVKTPLIVGAIAAIIVLAFPAESHAAVIQCNASGCPPLDMSSWWSGLEPRIKHGIYFWCFAAPTMLFFIVEDMVSRRKWRKEQEEFTCKYK